jgi:FkbM family methyltransferase
MELPFKMIVETSIEQWRELTFWEKEPETLKWIESFTDGDTFYDVGANIGIYSLFCASLFPNSYVFSFEPDYINQLRLQQNRNLNEFTNMFCFRFAISDRVAVENFYTLKKESGSTGGQLGSPVDELGVAFKPEFFLETPVFTIDHIIAGDILKAPNYIKIDVDGHEEAVLAGMIVTLRREDLKSVLIEVDFRKAEIAEVVTLFKLHGFTNDNVFNQLPNHSRHRRKAEGIEVENVIFVRI